MQSCTPQGDCVCNQQEKPKIQTKTGLINKKSNVNLWQELQVLTYPKTKEAL